MTMHTLAGSNSIRVARTSSCLVTRDEITDEQWALVEPLIPKPPRTHQRGRPWCDTRHVLSGILWVLRRNARWRDLPAGFPSYPTCYRRFRLWVSDGTLRRVIEALAEDLREREPRKVTEYPMEGSLLLIEERTEAKEKTGEAGKQDSWPAQTAELLQSPATMRLLRKMQSPLARNSLVSFYECKVGR
jgi:transposase